MVRHGALAGSRSTRSDAQNTSWRARRARSNRRIRRFRKIQNVPRSDQDVSGSGRDSGPMSKSRNCAVLAVLASLGLGGPANADGPERWRPNPNVGLLEGVTLRIHWFESSAGLLEAAQAAKNSGQDIKVAGTKGFSILKRNTATGEYVCDVYVVKMTGAQV